MASSVHGCVHCGLPVARSRSDEFCCYGCRIAHGLVGQVASDGSVPVNALLLRLGLGVFVTINLMVFNWLILSRHVFDHSATESIEPLISVVAYLLMFLCTIVLVALGIPLAADSRLRLSSINSDTLILVGVVAAYILSVINTLRGDDHLYFDTAAIILVLVTLGRYLDSLAKTQATRATAALLPQTCGEGIHVGDRVIVRVGETIPVDGKVIDGRAQVDQAILTGESRLVRVGPGDHVLAGGISADGLLVVRAESVGQDRVIAAMQRMLEEARLKPPRISQLADRVARVFVPIVMVLAVGVFVHRGLTGNWAGGVMDGLCVLLISCPCALGLAGPLATWTALGRAARLGILIDSGWTLERAASVKHIFFDKTGTLTGRQMILKTIEAQDQHQALAIAAAMESGSTHPIAAPIIQAAQQQGIDLKEVQSVAVLPGLGLRAEIDGQVFTLTRCDADHNSDETVIELASQEITLARFILLEQLRGDAKQTTQALMDMGITVEVLTGDQPGPAARIGRELDLSVHAGLLPAGKVDYLHAAQHQGMVAMVGDGINDAPVLGASDVSFAMGSATDLARLAGHIHLTGDSLAAVPTTLAIARHAMGRIRLNLLWAFGYNCVGLAMAVAGLLTPVIAALAMLGSSLLIVMTSRGAGGDGR